MRKNMSRFSGTEEQSEINLTPMLDVVFIMLIFFIVTASFIKQAGIDVLRPEAVTGEQRPTVSVLVAISETGEIWSTRRKSSPPLCAPQSSVCTRKTRRAAWWCRPIRPPRMSDS